MRLKPGRGQRGGPRCRRAIHQDGSHANKRELFLAANDVLLNNGFGATAAFTSQLASRYGPGIAEAVVWREFSKPAHAVKRSLALEANRLARFDEPMRKTHDSQELALVEQLPDGPQRAPALAQLHTEIALALGLHLVSNLATEAWALPFDTVTVPLIAGLPSSTP